MNYKLTKPVTPMLETDDLRATIDFYTRILGFVCDRYEEGWGWVHLTKDAASIMFSVPNEHRKMAAGVMSGSLYFNPDDVEGLWESVKDVCKICYPLARFEYGMREFAIYDNNGYLLQFGQE
jgi:uncharacterized glyoxalase superfamily protein PhnB